MTFPILIIWNLGFISSANQSLSYGEMKAMASKSSKNILDMLNLSSFENVSEPLISDPVEDHNSSDNASILISIGWRTKSILIMMLFCGAIISVFGVYQFFI